MKQLKIVLADDHPLMLKTIRDFLIKKKYNIVDTASEGRQAFQIIKKWQPDIAIIDNQMPFYSGLEVAKLCADHQLKTQIILVTFDNESLIKNNIRDLNISGYVLKESALEEIEDCIESVSKNLTYCSKKLMPETNNKKIGNNDLNVLTPSEIKILKLIAKNISNTEIAEKLLINTQILEEYYTDICKKIKIKTIQELKDWGIENQQDILAL